MPLNNTVSKRPFKFFKIKFQLFNTFGLDCKEKNTFYYKLLASSLKKN